MEAALAVTAPGVTGAPAGQGISPDPPPLVDVVVVAYNSRDTLRTCVESLTHLHWAAVSVVDNACPEDSTRVIEDLPLRIIHSGHNGGFAYGCNRGLVGGRGEFVLLLNPDATIDAASLAALVDALRADPWLGAAGPQIVDGTGAVLFTQRRFPRLRSTYAQGLFLHRVAPLATWTDDVVRDPTAYEQPGTPDWVSGCCVLVRREAFASVGGLDERFFLYAEETDLFKRLKAAGWRVGFEPRATARHEGQGSASPNATEHFRAASRVQYARKHHGRMIAAFEGIGLALSALTHAAASIHHPARARGHMAAAGAALRAARSTEASS